MANIPLRINDSNEDVMNLHKMLKQLGYPTKELTDTFNTKTQSLVRAFQNDSGLAQSETVDYKTWEALQKATGNNVIEGTPEENIAMLEGLEQQQQIHTALQEQPILNTETEAIGKFAEAERPAIRNGSRGEEVVLLQTLLKALGYAPGGIDGIFGNHTEKAVRDFQRNNGLVLDGIVGKKTWFALYTTYSTQANHI